MMGSMISSRGVAQRSCWIVAAMHMGNTGLKQRQIMPMVSAFVHQTRFISGTKAERARRARKRALENRKNAGKPQKPKEKQLGYTTIDDVTHLYSRKETTDDGELNLRPLDEKEVSLALKKKKEKVTTKSNESEKKPKKYNFIYKGKRKAPFVRVDRILANRGIGTRAETQELCKYRRISLFLDLTHDHQQDKHLLDLLDQVRNVQPWFGAQQPVFDEWPPIEIIPGPTTRVPEDAYLLLDQTHIIPPLPTAFMYHKPKGVLSSMSPEGNRPYLAQMLPTQLARASAVHPVGRLDFDTSGLLLFSTRGDLTQKLLHPKHEISKEYVAIVEGAVNTAKLRHKLEVTGVTTAEGVHKGQLLNVKINDPIMQLSKGGDDDDDVDSSESVEKITSEVRLVVSEGKHRMVRRMLANCGHPVLELKRERQGECLLGDLPQGSFRTLNDQELDWITSLVN